MVPLTLHKPPQNKPCDIEHSFDAVNVNKNCRLISICMSHRACGRRFCYFTEPVNFTAASSSYSYFKHYLSDMFPLICIITILYKIFNLSKWSTS